MATAEATPTYLNGEPVEGSDEAEETPTVTSTVDDQLDDLEIQVEARDWIVKGTLDVMDPRSSQNTTMDFERTYTQKPLSYTAMLQFTGLIGERVQSLMKQGVTLESVLGDVQSMGGLFGEGDIGLTRDDFSGVDSFVQGLAKLATHLPDLIVECQCIWLRVPLHERPVVVEIWGRSPVDGGLSMQEGEDMLSLFIAQNYEELE